MQIPVTLDEKQWEIVRAALLVQTEGAYVREAREIAHEIRDQNQDTLRNMQLQKQTKLWDEFFHSARHAEQIDDATYRTPLTRGKTRID